MDHEQILNVKGSKIKMTALKMIYLPIKEPWKEYKSLVRLIVVDLKSLNYEGTDLVLVLEISVYVNSLLDIGTNGS